MEELERKKLKHFVLGELFDLTLYQKLLELEEKKISSRPFADAREIKADGSLRKTLSELANIEKKHLEFWQEVTGIALPKLSLGDRVKLNLFLSLRMVFGSSATILILEMIEIYAVKEYFSVWEEYKGTELSGKLKEILKDEFEHEEKAIGERIERKINVDKIRAAILGFNDGFVEISGAMGGFFAAFADYFLVGFVGLIVGLAGSISMGAAAFLAARSAAEIEGTERRKKEILSQINSQEAQKELSAYKESPLSQAFYVGIFYFSAALLPVLPFLLGAKSMIFPIVIGILLVLLLSFFTAFFAGESFLNRLKLNSLIIVGAILVTYSISYLAKITFGVEI